MKMLLIDTSSDDAWVAVWDGEKIAQGLRLIGGPSLSETLAPAIGQLLAAVPPPYDRIAVASGPGSYTGIRVGASVAAGLALSWGLPLLPLPSLPLLAPPLPPAGKITLFRDAKTPGFYAQTGLVTSQGIVWDPPRLAPRLEISSPPPGAPSFWRDDNTQALFPALSSWTTAAQIALSLEEDKPFEINYLHAFLPPKSPVAAPTS
jgi:tRNA threonylcarbamoyl adenosine modification protein YeaZ